MVCSNWEEGRQKHPAGLSLVNFQPHLTGGNVAPGGLWVPSANLIKCSNLVTGAKNQISNLLLCNNGFQIQGPSVSIR